MKYVASGQSNMVIFYTKDEKFVYENSVGELFSKWCWVLVQGVGSGS